MPLFRRAVAEFIGTAWLVFGGCGSAVLAASFPHVGIGLLVVTLTGCHTWFMGGRPF